MSANDAQIAALLVLVLVLVLVLGAGADRGVDIGIETGIEIGTKACEGVGGPTIIVDRARSIAAASSLIDWKRRAGSFVRHRSTIAATASGTSGRTLLIGDASRLRIATAASAAFDSWKGYCRESRRKSVAPVLHTSVRASMLPAA